MKKFLDVVLLNSRGWKATTSLEEGLRVTHRCFLSRRAFVEEAGAEVTGFSVEVLLSGVRFEKNLH